MDPEKVNAKGKVGEVGDELQSGVVYIGHLPHGFYEEQLRSYFSQFGTVKRVKVARNKRTGRCKGFAFVEFQYDEVAKIVAQTMNNYLMFNKLLKCQFIDREKVHVGMLDKGRLLKRSVSLACRQGIARQQHNKSHTVNEHRQRIRRLLRKEKKKRTKLSEMGISYNFPGYSASVESSDYTSAPTHIKF